MTKFRVTTIEIIEMEDDVRPEVIEAIIRGNSPWDAFEKIEVVKLDGLAKDKQK